MSRKPSTSSEPTPTPLKGDQASSYLATLVASSDDALIGKSPDGTILSWNAAAERLYGYSAEEAVGRNVSLIVPPEGRGELSDLLERIRRGERIQHRPVQRRRKNGALILVSLSVSPVQDVDGTIIGTAAMARGIVEDRSDSADEAARYARSLIEMSINPLVTINPQGRITDVNMATEEATGIAREELIGTDFADCFSEPEKARAGYQRVLEEGLLSDYALVLRHVSGALTNVEYNATVYRDEAGDLQAVFAAARDATEAQKARLQVARLAAIVTASQNARYSRDLQGTITSWNAAAEALYGYAATEAIGRNGTILLPPGHGGETQDLIKRMLRGDRGFGFETQRLCKDGSLLDVALAVSPTRNAGGDITGLSIIAHDISRRVRAERELRESKEKFAAAFHASPDLMAITRLSNGRFLEVNEGFTQLLGYTRDEALGKTIEELSIWVDPADRAAFVAGLEESGQSSVRDTTLRCKDGSLVTGIDSARTIEMQGETCVLSIIHDITKRKHAEEALRQVEERYRALFDRSLDCVYLHDFEGRFLDANEAALALLGYSQEEIRSLTFASLLDGAQLSQTEAVLQELRATGQQQETYECRLRRKDGRLIDVETQASVVLRGGKPYAIQGIARDISRRKQAEEALVEGAAQLSRSLGGAVAALGATTEMRDPYTAGHQRRVAEFACAVAAELGWDERHIEMLNTAALLHDIGKIVVPAEILVRPGRLSELEMSLIRQHAAVGAEAVASIDFDGDIAEMIRQHHERLDGSGYPGGLSGNAILPEARILGVADVVEAMSSHRPYRAALGMEAALDEVREHAGVKYDAGVVAACVRLVEEKGFEFTP